MSIAITLLTVLLLFVCLLMVFVILMQRPKQEGLGAAFGGGMTDQMFGAQTSNVLQKGTVYFAIFYFIASAGIAVLVSNKQEQSEASKDLLEGSEAPAIEELVVPEGATPAETPESTSSSSSDAAAEDMDGASEPEVIQIPAVETSETVPADTGDAPEAVEPPKPE